MISNMVKWLSDPETKAKKRTLLVFLVALAGGLKASVPLFQFICTGVESSICKVDVNAVAGAITQLTNLLNTPEVGGVALLTGLYAIFSGYKKDKK